jgi:subtilase family serine protease
MRTFQKTVGFAFFALGLSAAGAGSARAELVHVTHPAPLVRLASAARRLAAPLSPHSIVPNPGQARSTALCTSVSSPDDATCFAAANLAATIPQARPAAVNGLTPADLSLVYAFPRPGLQGELGAGQTVAIVVAGDYANAAADLAVYRSYYSLTPCTIANACFTKVGAAAPRKAEDFSSRSISANPTSPSAIGWAAEADIDMDVTSAVCPNCRIMLAEAKSNSLTDLTSAVKAAIVAGATIVNASYGAAESSYDRQFDSVYENGRVKVVASAGDWGYGVYYPAADPDVVAVGGTSLVVNGTAVSETVWAGTGSGCSAVFKRSSWQAALGFAWQTCTDRAVADVAAVGDPRTGVAMYDSALLGSAGGGWTVAGGTSVSAPLIAAMYALSGDTARGIGAQRLYAARSGSFLQLTSGSNGVCSPAYLCTAGPGYNGPAGLGVPQGLTGF